MTIAQALRDQHQRLFDQLGVPATLVRRQIGVGPEPTVGTITVAVRVCVQQATRRLLPDLAIEQGDLMITCQAGNGPGMLANAPSIGDDVQLPGGQKFRVVAVVTRQAAGAPVIYSLQARR